MARRAPACIPPGGEASLWTSAWPDPGAVSSFLSQPCFFSFPPLSQPAPAPSALCSPCPCCWVASLRFGILLAPSPPREGASRIPPAPAQPCRRGWGGEDLGKAETTRAPLLLLVFPALPVRAPRTRPGTRCQRWPGAPRPCFATVWCQPAAGPSRQPRERNVSPARVGKGQCGQRGRSPLPPRVGEGDAGQHSTQRVLAWRKQAG